MSSENNSSNDDNKEMNNFFTGDNLSWIALAVGGLAALGLGGYVIMDMTNKENQKKALMLRQQQMIQAQQQQARQQQQQKPQSKDLSMPHTVHPNINYSAELQTHHPYDSDYATANGYDLYDNNSFFAISQPVRNKNDLRTQPVALSKGSMVEDVNLNHNNFDHVPVVNNPAFDPDELPSVPAVPQAVVNNLEQQTPSVREQHQIRRTFDSESDTLDDILN